MGERDFGAAELRFRWATELDPGCAEAWNKLATAQFLQGSHGPSLRNIRRTLKLEPKHLGALSGRSQVLVRMGRFSEAAEALWALDRVSPLGPLAQGSALAMEAVGVALGVAGSLARALAVPAAPWARGAAATAAAALAAALVALAGGAGGPPQEPAEWTHAETQLQTERRRLPDGSVAVVSREQRTVRVTRTGAPLGELRRAVAALDSNADRAEVSARLLDELAAAESLARAEAIANLTWKAWLYHENPAVVAAMREGSELMAAGELTDAEWRFLKVVHFDPGYAEAWNKLATVHYLMGQSGTSLSEVDQTLELEPFHFGALSGRGLVLMQMERFGEAAQAFREVLEVYPAAEGAEMDAAFAEAMQREVAGDGAP